MKCWTAGSHDGTCGFGESPATMCGAPARYELTSLTPYYATMTWAVCPEHAPAARHFDWLKQIRTLPPLASELGGALHDTS